MKESEIIAKIPGLIKKTANRYDGRCPCPNHTDRHNSFSVYINKEWINPICFAGCSKEDILKALNLRQRDLHID